MSKINIEEQIKELLPSWEFKNNFLLVFTCIYGRYIIVFILDHFPADVLLFSLHCPAVSD